MIGRLIDDRSLVRSRIARGGMATVYLATDTRLERRVAIKIMHDHLAVDEAFRERFVREARSAAKLAHPNVVNVFDQGDDAGVAYMVMEYVRASPCATSCTSTSGSRPRRPSTFSKPCSRACRPRINPASCTGT